MATRSTTLRSTTLRSTTWLACWSVALGLALPAAAEELSLAQALALARENNPAVQAARSRVEAAEGAVDVARAELFPTLGVMTGYSDYSGEIFYGRFVSPAPGVPLPRRT